MGVFSACRHDRQMLRRLSCLLACAAICLAMWPGGSRAGILELTIEHYFVHVGDARANYFDGALLTANDLNEEQSYKRSADRYIQPTDKSLAELFQPAGFADVVLLLDEADPLSDKRTEVKDAHDRFADDFIVLNLQYGTWRGRLFLEEFGDIQPGVYDDLSGSFQGLVSVPEPAALALLAFGIAGIGLLRIRQTA